MVEKPNRGDTQKIEDNADDKVDPEGQTRIFDHDITQQRSEYRPWHRHQI
jgi:hypothetical protein